MRVSGAVKEQAAIKRTIKRMNKIYESLYSDLEKELEKSNLKKEKNEQVVLSLKVFDNLCFHQ